MLARARSHENWDRCFRYFRYLRYFGYFGYFCAGAECSQNWDEQNGRGLHDAPAVFGTAEAMEEFCNRRAGGGHLDLRNACRQVCDRARRIRIHMMTSRDWACDDAPAVSGVCHA